MKRLVVIGAGPKAMALASKNAVLRSLGYRVPELHVVERRAVGANWIGEYGFTDGKQVLGTSPEKDVGFPYASSLWGSRSAEVNRRVQVYSWSAFLVATGRYSEWVDRGRPAPEHRLWAAYLQWVAGELRDEIRFHCGEAFALRREGDLWAVAYRNGKGEESAAFGDGVVFTGPLRTKLPERLPVHDRLLDVESFWKGYRRFQDHGPAAIAVVGTGENAASIATTLSGFRNERLRLDVISSRGAVYSRGESYLENRVYSDPETGEWSRMSLRHRREFISRTDRGVFSLQAQRALDGIGRLQVVPGRVEAVESLADGRLRLRLAYRDGSQERDYDYVILATGSDTVGFLRRVMAPGEPERLGLGEERELERRIGFDLAVEGLTPRLHFPMLSGMQQGPGFANLSCLGRLSDRILSSYVEAP